MEENDEQRRALIHEYYQIYRALQKRHSLSIAILTYTAITLLKSGSMRAKGKGAASAK